MKSNDLFSRQDVTEEEVTAKQEQMQKQIVQYVFDHIMY